MKIEVTGTDRLIKKLEAYKKSIEDKQHELLDELAKIGINTADAEFKTAQYDGDNDVVVNNVPAWISDNQLAITATGQSITFIEFGSGVYYSEQHPKASEFGYERGAYGQGKGSQNTWGYYGVPGTNGEIIRSNEKGDLVITHGNPPARVMYDAGKEMRSVMVDIARKVWAKHY